MKVGQKVWFGQIDYTNGWTWVKEGTILSFGMLSVNIRPDDGGVDRQVYRHLIGDSKADVIKKVKDAIKRHAEEHTRRMDVMIRDVAVRAA